LFEIYFSILSCGSAPQNKPAGARASVMCRGRWRSAVNANAHIVLILRNGCRDMRQFIFIVTIYTVTRRW